MYKTLSLTAAIILLLSTLTYAEFPAEEAWSVEFEEQATCLGPNWEEDGQTQFLIGLRNQAIIVSEGEIVWESPEFGTEDLEEVVTAVNRIDFGVGDGAEIIVATIQFGNDMEMETDTGKVYMFSGEDYENLVIRGPFLQDLRGADFGLDNREVKQIHVFSHMLPDTSKRIVTCNRHYSYVYFWRQYVETGNLFVAGEEANLINDEIGFPVSSTVFDYGEEQFLVFVSSYKEGNDLLIEGFEGFEKRNTIGILNSDGDLVRNKVLGEMVTDSLFLRNYGDYCSMYGMTIYDDAEGDPNLYVAYSDTVPRPRLVRLSFEELETENEMFLPLEDVGEGRINIHHFHWEDLGQGENMLVCIASDGRVVAVDPTEMVETERGDFNVNCKGAAVGNFDDDEQLELAYLSNRDFHLFDVSPLSTPKPRHHVTPTTYSITSAYPNPFNSRTVIEYSLPRAGRYMLTVYDVSGVEVTSLADEWKVAGEYSTVWDAANQPAGVYFCRLDGEGNGVTVKMVLVK